MAMRAEAADFARAIRGAGLTPGKLLSVIPGDAAYTPDLWADSACDNFPLWIAVRDAVASGVLLCEEMRGAARFAAVPAVEPAGP